MILSRNQILEEIKNKRIKIAPFKKSQVGPASIDLTLDNQFRIFINGKKQVSIKEKTNYKKYTKLIKRKFIVLEPGQFILGITKEKIKLPSNICGRLQGRSRFARLGLGVHINASFISPGINNKQVLEIKNHSPFPIKLNANERICQLNLERMEGEAVYRGKYRSQKL